MQVITKAKTKFLQSLQKQKYRKEHNAYVVEGSKNAKEWILDPNTIIKEIICTEKWLNVNNELLALKPNAEVSIIKDQELPKVSLLQTPNQVLLIVKSDFGKKGVSINPGEWTIVLERIQDPGNLGTIIRTADWFGIKNVVCSLDTVEYLNPKVIQSSMGSLLRVSIYETDLITFFNEYNNIPVYAATLEGEDIRDIKNIEPGCILMGNESQGLSLQVKKLANTQVTIPRLGNAESLNVSIATAILCSKFILK